MQRLSKCSALPKISSPKANKLKILFSLFVGLFLSLLGAKPVLAQAKISNIQVATEVNIITARPTEVVNKISPKTEKVYITFNIKGIKTSVKVGFDVWRDGDSEHFREENTGILYDDGPYYLLLFEKPASETFPIDTYRVKILLNGKTAGEVSFEVTDKISATTSNIPTAINKESSKNNKIILLVLSVIFAIIPSIFWLWIYRRKDKADPEPRKLIFKLFFLGALGAIPIALIESFGEESFLPTGFESISDLSNLQLFKIFLICFTVVAPIEEIGKFLLAKWTTWKSNCFNQVVDGIIYCVSVALGFAMVENFVYFLVIPLNSNEILLSTPFSYAFLVGILVGLFIMRFLISTLAHTLFSGVVGFYMGKARFDTKNQKKLIFKGLLIAIIGHGIFNFMLYTGLGYYSLILIFGFVGFLFSKFKNEENFWIRNVAKEKDLSKPIYAPDYETTTQPFSEDQLDLNKVSQVTPNQKTYEISPKETRNLEKSQIEKQKSNITNVSENKTTENFSQKTPPDDYQEQESQEDKEKVHKLYV